jgi:ribose transport system ATP-binding protein
MIHQELSLAPHLTVAENILLGVEPTRLGFLQRSQMAETATRALRELGHEDLRPDTFVGTLPIPVQQIVEIARAIAVGCRVLVLDEPTSSLGREDARRLFGMLKLRGQGTPLSTSRISSKRSPRSPIDSPCSVMDAMRAAEPPRRHARCDRRDDDRRIGADPFPARAAAGGRAYPDRRCAAAGRCDVHAAPREVFGIAGLIGAGRTRLLAHAVWPGTCPERQDYPWRLHGRVEPSRSMAAGHGHAG